MAKSKSNRILSTPSAYAKEHFLYVQEVGSLESLEPHISQRQNLNSFLFFIVTSGQGTLSYRNQLSLLETGDCVWIDCHQPYYHESSREHPWTLMWVHFNGVQASSHYRYFLEQGNHYLFHAFDPLVFTNSLAALYEAQLEANLLTELRSNKFITDIMTDSFQENKRKFPEENSISDKLTQIRSFIDKHAQEKITLEQLSERFFISKFHLSREYKKAYGITIGHAIASKRIAHAKSALRFSSAPIEQVAGSCGFQDAAYFIKVFKKAEGLTPLEYRKKW